MINILKMDLHRFRTNKVMYLLLLIFAAFQIFGIYMIKTYEQPIEAGGLLIGEMNESQFMQMMLSQPPSWILLYITVFCVYFYMSEYNSGFYKNYISLKHARLYSVISKWIVSGLFTALIFIVMIIANGVGRSLFFHKVTIGDPGYLMKLIIGQYLLHWAFSIVILCIAMISRNLIVSIIIGLVLVLNVVGMLVGAVASLIDLPDLSSYLLVNTIMSGKDFNNMRDLLHVAAVSVVSILLFSSLAVRYKLKEDLK